MLAECRVMVVVINGVPFRVRTRLARTHMHTTRLHHMASMCDLLRYHPSTLSRELYFPPPHRSLSLSRLASPLAPRPPSLNPSTYHHPSSPSVVIAIH